MPFLVECPSCSSRINAPDKLAGKTVKCPKCKSAFTLPSQDAGFEVVEDNEPVVARVQPIQPAADPGFELVDDDEPVVAKVKPKKFAAVPAFEVIEDEEPVTARPKKKSRPPVVEEDDDEFDDRPSRKKQKVKKGLSPVVLYGSIAGILLLIGLALGVFILSGGGLFGPKWTKFDAPDGSFSTAFPGGEPSGGDFLTILSGGSGGNPEQIAQAKKIMEQMGMTMNGWSREEKGRKYIAAYLTIPPQMAALVKPDQIMSQGFNPQNTAGASLMTQEDTTVSGQKAKQVLAKKPGGKQFLMRYFFANGRVYVIGVEGDDTFRPDDAIAKAFFEKFELKTK